MLGGKSALNYHNTLTNKIIYHFPKNNQKQYPKSNFDGGFPDFTGLSSIEAIQFHIILPKAFCSVDPD